MPAGGTVRLRKDEWYFVTGSDNRIERPRRELGRPSEHHPHRISRRDVGASVPWL